MLWRSWVRIPALYTFFKKNRYRKLAYNSRDLVSSSYLATRDLEIWSQMYYLWRFRIGHSIRPSHEISKCQFIEMVSVIFGAEATDRRFGKNVLEFLSPQDFFKMVANIPSDGGLNDEAKNELKTILQRIHGKNEGIKHFLKRLDHNFSCKWSPNFLLAILKNDNWSKICCGKLLSNFWTNLGYF